MHRRESLCRLQLDEQIRTDSFVEPHAVIRETDRALGRGEITGSAPHGSETFSACAT
jgi:hypothetical protein